MVEGPRFPPVREKTLPPAVAGKAGRMSTSREKILNRLRAANPSLDVREPARALPVVPQDDLSPEALRSQFVTQAEKL